MSDRKGSSDNRSLLLKYAGLATQWAIIILVSIYAGKKTDIWFRFKQPIWAWVLPLLSILGMLIHIIRDTSNPKKK
jgi:hypothetical protein